MGLAISFRSPRTLDPGRRLDCRTWSRPSHPASPSNENHFMNLQQLKKIAAFYARFTLSFTQVGYLARKPFWPAFTPDFKGQHWLVTGATGGLGKQIALSAARAGAIVTAAARSAEKLAQLVADAKAMGINGIETELCDFSLQSDTARLHAQTRRLGPKDRRPRQQRGHPQRRSLSHHRRPGAHIHHQLPLALSSDRRTDPSGRFRFEQAPGDQHDLRGRVQRAAECGHAEHGQPQDLQRHRRLRVSQARTDGFEPVLARQVWERRASPST